MAYTRGYSREASVISGQLMDEYSAAHQYPTMGGFEVIPEEVAVTHGPTGVELGGSLRQADAAFTSWRIDKAPSTSLTSALNLSTRSSDVDLKDFLVKRGRHPLQGLHKAAAQGDRASIMQIMKQLGPDAPLNELDTNGCTPLMYAVMAESRLAIEMLLNFSAKREQTDQEGRTAVHYAAFFGKFRALRFLIDAASDWISRDMYGRTPLHWACSSKSTRSLTVLLKHAQTVLSDINPRDNEGMTPLHCAAQFSRPRHIMLLSEAECDLTAVDMEEKTALHWTVGNRDSACMQTLLDIYPPLLNRQDVNGSTLLHLTAASGYTHLVETLLRVAGIDIDLKDNTERTPLHYCSQGGHSDIVQLLLAFGALDSCIDAHGLTALHYAVQSNSTASVHAFTLSDNMSHLPDGNEGRTPLMMAAQNDSESIVKVLLQNHSVVKSINHADTDGRTALHLASQCGSEQCTTLLLSHGAEPNLQDSLQQTSLLAASMAGHTSCIHPLIAGGADSMMVDADGHTPLFKAVLYSQSRAVLSLVLAGVDLNVQDASGSTAVHMAAYSGDSTVLSVMLENGANPNIQDASGLSPIHIAALEGHTHCVTALASHRAYLNHMDFSDERLTPLDYAVQNGHSECVEELRRNGAVSVANIKEMAAIAIQTVFRGCRARRLRATLKQQSQAVTVLAKHMRTYLHQKRYGEMKKRHYAAIKIQAVFRGHCQRLKFEAVRAKVWEKERKRALIENFARLVTSQKDSIQPFPKDKFEGEIVPASVEQQAKERKSRLEAAMKMRDIYEEKQKRWEAFRVAEKQRRIDKAEQAELDRLAGILARSKARREYTQQRLKQTLSVRSHHHAALVIQRTFRAMKSRRSWLGRLQARLAAQRRKREHEAAATIQHAWRRYWQSRLYQATHFKPIYTGPVVFIPEPAQAIPTSANHIPSYKRDISITGNPRRKIHQTELSGFRVPRPATHDLVMKHISPRRTNPFLSPFPAQDWRQATKEVEMVRPSLKQGFLTNPTSASLEFPQLTERKNSGILPQLISNASSPTKTPKSPKKPMAFHLPQIIPT